MLGNDVFRTEEDIRKYLLEQEKLQDEINENAKVIAEMTELQDVLEQKYKVDTQSHKQMMDLKSTKEKAHAEKKSQIDALKRDIQNAEYKLNLHETIEKEHSEQRVTTQEYQCILDTIKTLKTESEILERDGLSMADGLNGEHGVLEHNANCTRLLSNYDLNDDNLKKLIKQEKKLKIVSNTLEELENNKLTTIMQQKLESEQNLLNMKETFSRIQNEHKKWNEVLLGSLNQHSEEIDKVKNEIGERSSNNLNLISDYNAEIIKLEANMEKLKKDFTREYVEVSKVEKRVMDKFNETLSLVSSIGEKPV